METTEMDAMEEEEPQPNPNSLKRFALKNSIQTNFGDDYVFQIVARWRFFLSFVFFPSEIKRGCDCNWFDFFSQRDDWTAMAVSLSTNAVKLYSPVTGQYLGECRGHSTTINHISFSGPGNSHILHSCSSDGTIRAWDTRTFNQVPFFLVHL